MFNKYFGNYILTQKVLTPEQLKNVLLQQESTRVKLGILAIDSGCMTAFQVNRVHKLQTLQDKRFGEIAISEGFLTEDRLIELLDRQKTSEIMLGQVLVDDGLLDYEQYEALLANYKKDSGFSDQEIEILKSNDTDAIVGLFIDMEKTGVVELFSEYIELFIRNIVRFVYRDVIISKPYQADTYSFEHYAGQQITGAHAIDTGISADTRVFAEFAGIYAEESLTGVDEIAKDALGEFMNSQNGLFVSNLYHKNIHCDLVPQQYQANHTIKKRNRLFVMPCELSFGKIEIVFNI